MSIFLNLDDFVRLLGDLAGVISCDEKATVPLGLPAVSRTTRYVMDINASIETADHTFAIGSKQFITLTVISGVNYDVMVFYPPLYLTFSGFINSI